MSTLNLHEYLKSSATVIMMSALEAGTGGTRESQSLCVAEEAGEFIGEYRRWQGMARRSGTERKAQDELADVIVSAYSMAEVMGWDVEEIVRRKLEEILTRGWKETDGAQP